jgi:hypothetical protein
MSLVVTARARQDFDGDVAIEPGVAAAIDLAHATFAELGDNVVRTEAGAWSQRQLVGGEYMPLSALAAVRRNLLGD